MTISTTSAKSRYAGDGVTTEFPTGFKFMDNSHVKVVLGTAAGAEVVWTEGSEYDLDGAGAPGGGTVTVRSSPVDHRPAPGDVLVIKLAVPPRQETSLPLGGAFPSTAVEGMADLAALRDQQIEEALSRAPKFRETTALAEVAFPEPAAGRLVAWNAEGNGLENVDRPTDGRTVLSGSGAPSAGLGHDGDIYIDLAAYDFYGPKAGGWASGVSLIGPAGPAGADGRTIHSGAGTPSPGLGAAGDFYIDTAGDAIYGPKSGGGWGAASSLVGPEGPQGSQGVQGLQGMQGPQGDPGDDGSDGVGVPAGGDAGQVLAKASAADHDTHWVNQSGGGGGSATPTLVFTALNNVPPAANYATLDTRNGHPVLDFDGSSNESAVFGGVLPAGYGGGGLTVDLHYAMTEATSGDIDWDVAIERIGDQHQNLDSDGFAAANSVNDTTVPGTAGLVDVVTIAFTDGADMDNLAAGEAFRLRVTRDAASDTAGGDAELLAVHVRES